MNEKMICLTKKIEENKYTEIWIRPSAIQSVTSQKDGAHIWAFLGNYNEMIEVEETAFEVIKEMDVPYRYDSAKSIEHGTSHGPGCSCDSCKIIVAIMEGKNDE